MKRSKIDVSLYAMKILSVRIGDKYGPEYEKYLEKNYPTMNSFG